MAQYDTRVISSEEFGTSEAAKKVAISKVTEYVKNGYNVVHSHCNTFVVSEDDKAAQPIYSKKYDFCFILNKKMDIDKMLKD